MSKECTAELKLNDEEVININQVTDIMLFKTFILIKTPIREYAIHYKQFNEINLRRFINGKK